MASQDEQYLRLKKIHEQLTLFPNGVVPKSKLMDVCDTPPRTFHKDIQKMRDFYEAPIVFDRKQGGYRYTKPFELLIHDLALSEKELKSLEVAGATLTQFRGLKVFRDVQGVFDKIDKAIGYRLGKSAAEKSYVQFEEVPYFKGSEWIPLFYQAIEKEQVIHFSYQKFGVNEPKKWRKVEPYWLKEHKNRWYVIGLEVEREKDIFKIFGLDRIVYSDTIKIGERFLRSETYKFEDLQKHNFGLYYSQERPVEIELWFEPTRAQYFKAQPFVSYQDYQVLQDDEEGMRINLRLVPNREFIMELAKLGDSVQVLKPDSLRQDLINYLCQAINQYDSPSFTVI